MMVFTIHKAESASVDENGNIVFIEGNSKMVVENLSSSDLFKLANAKSEQEREVALGPDYEGSNHIV